MVDKRLTTMEERERLKKEELKLREYLKQLVEDEERVMQEIEKVRQQVLYYRALTKDMKKEIKPPTISDLMESLLIL
jgi:DNA primase large subunit